MKARVFIRADGSPQIGLGHIVRCYALALMLKADFTITFFCKYIPEKICNELTDNGFEVMKIAEEPDFLDVLTDNSIIVLDGYHFSTAYQKTIKNIGAKLVCIDDLFDKEFFADLIVNHAPAVKPADYRCQSYTTFALGPEYVLLRPAFLEQAQQERIFDKIETIMICFGGSDSKNLSAKIVEIVSGFSEFKKINLVTGAAYEYEHTLTEITATDNRIRHYKAIDEKQMLLVMRESDIAIVPSSGTLLEALACNCRVISGKYIDNQELLFERYKNAGMFINAGSFAAGDVYDAVRQALSSKQKQVKPFDGKSAVRLRERFLKL